jgi:hypothetical protein
MRLPQTVPEPTMLPVDREEWFKQLSLCNFVNAYYQYRDLHACGERNPCPVTGILRCEFSS